MSPAGQRALNSPGGTAQDEQFYSVNNSQFLIHNDSPVERLLRAESLSASSPIGMLAKLEKE